MMRITNTNTSSRTKRMLFLLAGLFLCYEGGLAQTQPFGGGAGTEASPYQISTLEHLNAIRGAFLRDTFLLMRDLNFNDANGDGMANDPFVYSSTPATNAMGWDPIGGGSAAFRGRFEGNGKVISNLLINRPNMTGVGLFGDVIRGGTVDGLGLEGVIIVGNSEVGGLVGSLVGRNNRGGLSNCYAAGNVSGRGRHVGGLVGRNERGGSLSNCYASVIVSGMGSVGGLLGGNDDGTIQNCYATGNVSGADFVGGLLGGNGGTIQNCYATGQVSGTSASSNIGGFAGQNSFLGMISNCYWNTQTSGQPTTGIGTDNTVGPRGLTTAMMYDMASYVGWDFAGLWHAPVNAGNKTFPRLRGLSKNGQVLHFPAISIKGINGHFTLDYDFLSPQTITGSTTRFSSSDETVATVDNMGFVTIIGVGETQLATSRMGQDEHVFVLGVRTLEVSLSLPTGLGEEETFLVRMFPNPVNGFLTLEDGEPYDRLEVYDLEGRLVHRQDEGHQVDLRAVPAGTYLVRIRAGNAPQRVRTIIVRK